MDRWTPGKAAEQQSWWQQQAGADVSADPASPTDLGGDVDVVVVGAGITGLTTALLLDEADALGTEHFATHHLPLEDAPEAYATFQKKEDGMVKTVFTP